MRRYLDLDRWPRRAAFEFFRGYDNPYFNVCAPIDVTRVVELTRAEEKVSFSLACLYLALRVVNEYEPFRYRLQGGRVLVHDELHAGTTTLLDGERLAFIYFDYHADFTAFCEGAARARQALSEDVRVIDAQDERTDLVHFSSLPWVSFTSISHARNWQREDSVPKITFGRYAEANGRYQLPVSVEVHHALMDGLHVARFFERLQRCFADSAAILNRG
jgi:chloramphenicol O-acetyltransferase type A